MRNNGSRTCPSVKNSLNAAHSYEARANFRQVVSPRHEAEGPRRCVQRPANEPTMPLQLCAIPIVFGGPCNKRPSQEDRFHGLVVLFFEIRWTWLSRSSTTSLFIGLVIENCSSVRNCRIVPAIYWLGV